jgi:2-octaprenylphenol hydroxylase
MALAPQEFARELTQDSDDVLGSLTLASDRAVFDLGKQLADDYVRERVALVGDAAHVVHPLAGQGVNLGVLDAAALVQVLQDATREGEDIGAMRILRRYERWRRSEAQLVSAAMDGFNRFLARGHGPIAALAQRALPIVGRSALSKRLLVERALGASGELPRAAR